MTDPEGQPLKKPKGHTIRAYFLKARSASVIDMSRGGLGLRTSVPLIIGQEYFFHLKSSTHNTLIEGEIIRCVLELEDTIAGQEPFYLNGIQFRLQPTVQEMGILAFIQSNRQGEKRVGGTRVRPAEEISVDVGSPDIQKILRLDSEGFDAVCRSPLENLKAYPVLLRLNRNCIAVTTQATATKTTAHKSYEARFKFLDLGEANRSTLRNFLQSLAETP